MAIEIKRRSLLRAAILGAALAFPVAKLSVIGRRPPGRYRVSTVKTPVSFYAAAGVTMAVPGMVLSYETDDLDAVPEVGDTMTIYLRSDTEMGETGFLVESIERIGDA